MIKAIETRYKGYRFRSRLEARWAVFFDALGLDWEYEPEGYVLPDGTKYLPDFYADGVYIEIKRKNAFVPIMHSKKVYLAGKISVDEYNGALSDTWRLDLCSHRDESIFEGFGVYSGRTEHLRPGFDYIGPFFTCNHGTPSCHERALSQIENCDFVFAWIDSNDAYGTIAEIVYAKTIGKPVYIAYGKNCDAADHWFVSKFADSTIGADYFWDNNYKEKTRLTINIKDAWDYLIERHQCSSLFASEEEKKVSGMSEVSDKVYLIMGDPMDHCLYEYKKGFTDGVARVFGDSSAHDKAAQKARSARFEHGEFG